MPTPFMHLGIAERIRAHGDLDDRVGERLRAEWPAFYLGSIAPDFQTICAIPRQDTHFYDLPPAPAGEAHQVMWTTYPELATAAGLPVGQAVFVAAYSAHLLLDLRWYRQVLAPHFLQTDHWQDHRQRFIIHNVLLTYLDKLALRGLPPTADATLARAEPAGWLPFAKDADLRRWRDFVAGQLEPGAAIQTVAIYAGRLAVSAAEFAANLEDPAWMEEHLFDRVPVGKVQAMLDTAVDDSVTLINQYLAGVD
jgi:hypothetical protein